MVLLVRHAEASERRAELLADNDHVRYSERTIEAGAEGSAMNGLTPFDFWMAALAIIVNVACLLHWAGRRS